MKIDTREEILDEILKFLEVKTMIDKADVRELLRMFRHDKFWGLPWDLRFLNWDPYSKEEYDTLPPNEQEQLKVKLNHLKCVKAELRKSINLGKKEVDKILTEIENAYISLEPHKQKNAYLRGLYNGFRVAQFFLQEEKGELANEN